MVLASCSLVEDITPPPGYQSISNGSNGATATPIFEQTFTVSPIEVTPTLLSTPLQSTASIMTGGTSTETSLGNIKGNLVNRSGSTIPAGQKVTLEGFDKDDTGNYQKTVELVTSADQNGSYGFKGVQMPQGRALIMVTSWEGVEYQSEPIIISDATADFSVPLSVYEATVDNKSLIVNQIHLIFDAPSSNLVQIMELFIITNSGKKAVVVSSNGTSIPFIHPPENAGNVQYQLSQGSAPLLNAVGGFAMIPGASNQYAIIASFTLPYGQSLKFSQPFSLPITSFTVLIPKGMHLHGEQLSNAGVQDLQGQSYQMYQANNMPSGSSISVTLSGRPGTANGLNFTGQTVVLLGIGLAGILLVGLGLYLYFRDRARLAREDQILDGIKDDAIGADRDSILDAVIVLDDMYKTGNIPQKAYQKRRSELLARLKEVI